MTAKKQRLLDPALLPDSLWDTATETLFLPPILATAYKALITRHKLLELSATRDPTNPPTGGHSQENTDLHFSQAFDGSVARVQLAVTDPKQEVSRVSNSFIQVLSGNGVCITDAPCGAGAATFAFLTTIAELREKEVLPRLPLDVHLIGAELSEPARQYAREMLKELTPYLESQAIFVQAEYLSWDVTESLSTTDLISQMTRASDAKSKRLLVVANFSAFLEREKKRDAAAPQLAELFRYASGVNSVAIWIEPRMNEATAKGGLFSWISSQVKKTWQRFVRVNTDGEVAEHILVSECQFHCPLDSKPYNVRLAVMRLDLERAS